MLKHTSVATTDGLVIKEYVKLSGRERIIKGLCVHNTNTIPINKTKFNTQAEQYTSANVDGNLKSAKVHYFVDNIEAWHSLSDTQEGAHSGDGRTLITGKRGEPINGNINTISIEGIGKESYSNLVKLTAYLLKKYNMNVYQDVYFHQDFADKNCPEYIQDRKAFLLDVEKQLKKLNQPTKHPLFNEIEEAIELGISDGSRPFDTCTRGECMAMMVRLYKLITDNLD